MPHKSVCRIASLTLFHVVIIDQAINILKRKITFRGCSEFTSGAWNLFGGWGTTSYFDHYPRVLKLTSKVLILELGKYCTI